MSMTPRLRLLLGDITAMNVDAIVNSTDTTLLNGGPVHRAVHAAAGPSLAKACQNLNACPPGSVRVTPGYLLKARSVVHTVAPIWMDGFEGEAAILGSCYSQSLELATNRGFKTIAFPSIGSGKHPQIPLSCAAPIAINSILDHLEKHELPECVTLICFDTLTFRAHQRALQGAPHNGPRLFQVKPCQPAAQILAPQEPVPLEATITVH